MQRRCSHRSSLVGFVAGIECNVCCWPAVADGNEWALGDVAAVAAEAAGTVVVVVVTLELEAHGLVVVAEAVVAGGIVGAGIA